MKWTIFVLYVFLNSCISNYLDTEEIIVLNDDTLLSGTLSYPKEKTGPFPLIVIVHGSGKSTREDYSYFQKLVLNNFAVFRYDKRGVGESKGKYSGVSIENSNELLRLLASDAATFIAKLKSNPKINADRIGVIGISQGGWIVPIIAEMDSAVKFIISVSGTPSSLGEEAIYSRLTGDDTDGNPMYDPDVIDLKVKNYSGPHGFNPRSILDSLDIPMLWIIGDQDQSIPVARSFEILEELRSKSSKISLIKVNNASHGLENIETGEEFNVIHEIVMWLSLNNL